MRDCEWLMSQMAEARWQRRSRRRLALRAGMARLWPFTGQHRRGATPG